MAVFTSVYDPMDKEKKEKEERKEPKPKAKAKKEPKQKKEKPEKPANKQAKAADKCRRLLYILNSIRLWVSDTGYYTFQEIVVHFALALLSDFLDNTRLQTQHSAHRRAQK